MSRKATGPLDPVAILEKWYSPGSPTHGILLAHSRAVARKAMEIAASHPELGADETFVYEAAMLHDIGIAATDAPGLCCSGTLPYVCHGIVGRRRLRILGLQRHGRVCETHVGTGISAAEIQRRKLPLPPRDMIPVSIEEQIICYADKFFSKDNGHPEREKAIHAVLTDVKNFGTAHVERFMRWHETFAA